jgi:NADPH:quinone reductase
MSDDVVSTSTSMSTTVATTMRRLVLKAPGLDIQSCQLEIEENVPIPQPGPGEVLIKVMAAAINPSDYGTWIRTPIENCPLPLGNEGCGIVTAIGGSGISQSMMGWYCKVGQKVGFAGLQNKQGAYSEYVITKAMENTFALPEEIPVEEAASFFINPYTVLGIFDTAKQEGCHTLVHTAAASQLGQMMVKLAPTEKMDIINVVRREDQATLLRELGATHVVIVSGVDDTSGLSNLQAKIKECNCTVAFDAIAGPFSGTLLDLMPKNGTVYVYGGLGGKVQDIDPMALIYHQKKLKGFYLGRWFQNGGIFSMIPRAMIASRKVNAGLLKENGWSRSQFVDTTIESAQADLVKLLHSSVTGKKLRIRFDQIPSNSFA